MCAKVNGVDICASRSYGIFHVFAYCATFLLVCMCFANPIMACINCTDDDDCVSPSCYCDPGSGCVSCGAGCSCDREDTDHVCCGVSTILYDDPDKGYVGISGGVLYVHKGTSVTFKAIPNACKDPFPSNKPKWSGSSGASGNGPTTTVTFNTLSTSTTDFKAVTAKCGNELTVPVIVYELTGTHAAFDYFGGRSTTKYGVAERVYLEFTVSPNGVTAAQMGGLDWFPCLGEGTLQDDNTSGTGTYVCNWITDSSVLLRLSVNSGPSIDKYVDASFTVVEPSGIPCTQHGTGVRHYYGHAGVGFKMDTYVLPKDVSFHWIGYGEGFCDAEMTGWYSAKYPNGYSHLSNGPVGMGYGNIDYGTLVLVPDSVWSSDCDPPPPHAAGTFNWPIPQRYYADGLWVYIATFNHYQTIDAAGTMTISKGDVGPFTKKIDDLDSSW